MVTTSTSDSEHAPKPLREFLPQLKRYLGVYVMQKTYTGLCGFLAGYEEASGTRDLKRFHEWLVLRGKGRSELYWPLLVLCEIYRDGELPDVKYLTEEQNAEANTTLLRLLEEYWASQSEPHSG